MMSPGTRSKSNRTRLRASRYPSLVALTPLVAVGAALWLPSASGEDAPSIGAEEAASSTKAPAPWRRSASFEKTLTRGTDGWRRDKPFVVKRVVSGRGRGGHAAKIATHGGSGGCSCPRMTFSRFSAGPGDEIWISGWWRIERPAKVSWSRLMNLGHFEQSGDPDNWYVGLVSAEPRTMEVVYTQYGGSRVELFPPRRIPKNRWFRVDLHFVLSTLDGAALSEWYVDGDLVGRTTARNMYSTRPLTFFNGGLSHFWPENGGTTIFFDGPRLTY